MNFAGSRSIFGTLAAGEFKRSAAEGARMAEALIGRLDRWLAANRPDYYSLLQPGATDADLDVFEAQFTLVLQAAA